MTLIYFAYGSNMLQERLERRVGKVKKLKKYVLKDFKLSFNCGIQQKFANIVPSKGSVVEGVLYEITDEQKWYLDYYEGFYKAISIDKLNKTVVFAYIGLKQFAYEEGIPELSYLNILLDGAKECGLKNLYNELLKYKLKNFNIQTSRHKKW